MTAIKIYELIVNQLSKAVLGIHYMGLKLFIQNIINGTLKVNVKVRFF